MIAAHSNELEEKIGYKFKNRELLKQSLTHSSFTNEQKINKQKDYENALSILKELVELPFSRYREIEYHNRGVLLIINILIIFSF